VWSGVAGAFRFLILLKPLVPRIRKGLMAEVSKAPDRVQTIVVADNDALIREAVGDFLRESGYRVHLACDGLQALDLCRREKPDCVVLDVIMPKLDGSQVCRLLRQDPELRKTFVVAFSSLGPRDYHAFPKMSADAYVAKGRLPITLQNLLVAIRQQNPETPSFGEGIFGYDKVKPRQVVREMLEVRAHLNNLFREHKTRLIGEKFTNYLRPGEKKRLDGLLREMRRATEPQRHHLILELRECTLPVQVCAVLDGKACTSFLVVLENAAPPETEASAAR
jgi:CheY-like chemotaxis protein